MTTFPITYPVLILVGPTAIGKTALSLELAKKFDCEIVSMDSMQVYRYMDIGTAKVTIEERDNIPHHLIDIINPEEDYDASCFVRDALVALEGIHLRGKIPIITGGTGLYLRALVEGLFEEISEYPEVRERYKEKLRREGRSKLHEELLSCDCESAKRIHVNDTQRLLRALEIYHGTGLPWSEHLRRQSKHGRISRFDSLLHLGLTCDRKKLYERINLRTSLMMDNGLIEEVSNLLNMGFDENLKSMSSIGYRHALHFIKGRWQREELERLLARDTRRYSKRQYTWFSKNKDLQWFDVCHPQRVTDVAARWLESCSVRKP